MNSTNQEQLPSAANLIIKEKFEERYKVLLGEEYANFLQCSTSYARKSIRVNTLKISVAECKKRLEKNWRLEQVPWCKEGFWIDHKGEDDEKRYDIGNTPEHILGYIYVQDAASMIPPVVLEPEKNETILDMCAAPGSKTSQIAAMMENTGIVIANDNQGSRLKALGINLQRTGARNVICTQMHGAGLQRTTIKFDRVLVDAPCSGTGTIRKSLANLKMWSPNIVKKFAADQKHLIKAGFECLKEEGVMVYSTCTLEPEENEGIVSWLLENYPTAEVEKIEIPINRSKPIVEFEGKKYNEQVVNTLRIYPQDNDTEGFFVARIRKK